jgi:RNA polymerase sigma factor (sigma-70 family)
MATVAIRIVLEHLRKAVVAGNAGILTDAQLLEYYLADQDEAAFEALVRRHGPMVLGVCKRVLGNAHDAEDAFQATFLVLVRKAASIRPGGRVGNWLHGVAYRTALKARGTARRRRVRETVVSRNEALPPNQPDDWRPVLDEEIERLPEKYRAALVLCDLEGKTHKEAARRLGWADGTLSTRLIRARQMLGERLSRRGVTVSTAALSAALAEHPAAACVPATLVTAAVQVQRLVSLANSGAIPPGISVLMEGAMRSMAMVKAKKLAALAVILVGTIGLGVGGYQHLPAEEPVTTDAPTPVAAPALTDTPPESARIPSGPLFRLALVRLDQAGKQLVIKRRVMLWQAVPVKEGAETWYKYRHVMDTQTETFHLVTWAAPPRLFDGRGREFDKKKLPVLLKKEVLALVLDGPPDAALFSMLKEDALVLQVPASARIQATPVAPIPAASAPRPAPAVAPPAEVPPPVPTQVPTIRAETGALKILVDGKTPPALFDLGNALPRPSSNDSCELAGRIEAFIGPGAKPDQTRDTFYLRCEGTLKVGITNAKPNPRALHARGDVYIRTEELAALCASAKLEGARLTLLGTATEPAQLFQRRKNLDERQWIGTRIICDINDPGKEVKMDDTLSVAGPSRNVIPSAWMTAAAKDFDIAEYYRRTGKPGAAYFYHELIRRRYPGTSLADASARVMKDLEGQVKGRAATPVLRSARIGQITITGHNKVDDSVIRACLDFYPGQELNYADLRAAERKLADSGLFNMDPERGILPTITVRESDNEFKDILVVVQEK